MSFLQLEEAKNAVRVILVAPGGADDADAWVTYDKIVGAIKEREVRCEMLNAWLAQRKFMSTKYCREVWRLS